MVMAAQWPAEALRQTDYDNAPCTICGDAGGWDNMAICFGCERCFHLRCLLPPQSTVPSGDWLCPACDPTFLNLAELHNPATVLQYRQLDPYLNDHLLTYLRSGRDSAFLPSESPRRIINMALSYRVHPKLSGWLLVYKKIKRREFTWLVCPPLQYRWDIIRVMHDALGHAGVKQTSQFLLQHFYWKGIKADTAVFVKCCDACQRRQLALPELPDLQEPIVYGPFKHLHVDLAGPFPYFTRLADGTIKQPVSKPKGRPPADATKRAEYEAQLRLAEQTGGEDENKAWIVLIVDYFTKVAEFGIITRKFPAHVARTFWDQWMCRGYPVPSHVTSDNGTEFAAEFHYMLERLGTEHVHTSVAHPAANGAAERLVGTLKDMLTKYINDHIQHWPMVLPTLRNQYMHRVHSATNIAPIEYLLGFKPQLPLPVGPVITSFHLDDSILRALQTQFDRNVRGWKDRVLVGRQRRQLGLKLKIDDWVLELVETGGPLGMQVLGPFRIVGFEGTGDVVALLETGTTLFRDKVVYRRHVSNLAKY